MDRIEILKLARMCNDDTWGRAEAARNFAHGRIERGRRRGGRSTVPHIARYRKNINQWICKCPAEARPLFRLHGRRYVVATPPRFPGRWVARNSRAKGVTLVRERTFETYPLSQIARYFVSRPPRISCNRDKYA